jgi:hypothetical protein
MTQNRISSEVRKPSSEAPVKVQRSRWPFIALCGAVLVVGGFVLSSRLMHFNRLPKMAAQPPSAQSATAVNDVEATPSSPVDARAEVELGHALFKQEKRWAALEAYHLALTLDQGAADEVMVHNLVDSFGRDEQPRAERLITRFKLSSAAPGLRHLTNHKSYKVRWAAVLTLKALKAANRGDYVAAWTKDLSSRDCEVRKHAVEELGQAKSRRALVAIRTAKFADQKTKQGGFLGLFTHTCLGDAPDTAEKRILAQR